jgi:hypothetical protein
MWQSPPQHHPYITRESIRGQQKVPGGVSPLLANRTVLLCPDQSLTLP